MGAIRRSFSPWTSAAVLVKKKDGGLRLCIDLQKLNNHTVKDGYTLPRIDDTLDCLHGAVWFSTFDLESGYWEVELEEETKPLTAFCKSIDWLVILHLACRQLRSSLYSRAVTTKALTMVVFLYYPL